MSLKADSRVRGPAAITRRVVSVCVATLSLIVAGCNMPHVQSAQQAATEPDPEPAAEPEPIERPREPSERDNLPALAIAGVNASEQDRVVRFPVSLSHATGDPVTVEYATEDRTARAGQDYTATRGTLRFPALSTHAQHVEVAVRDDSLDESAETFTVRLSNPSGATLATASAIGTIVDDDERRVTAKPAALNVIEGQTGSYTVVLGSQPTAPVTVTVSVSTAELSAAPQTLRFTPTDWTVAQAVEVAAAQDPDALGDAPVELTHTVRGGDYTGTPALPVTVTIVEDDAPTLWVAASSALEGSGAMIFDVTLSVATDQEVTVAYATGAPADTATAGTDYAGGGGGCWCSRSARPPRSRSR